MNSQQQHPKEVFCGNLAFFCQESDLFQLFQDYSRVRSVRVIRNQERTKSLMFGFVRFETNAEAEEMARVFNGQMFMGRRIKVTHPNVPDNPHPDMLVGDGEGPPVHLSFICSKDNPTLPTELILRKAMVQFGPVNDVTVREFMFNDATQRCEGYGFVSFFTKQTSFELASITNEIVVDGISIRPSLSYRGTGANPMMGGGGFPMPPNMGGFNGGGGGGRGFNGGRGGNNRHGGMGGFGNNGGMNNNFGGNGGFNHRNNGGNNMGMGGRMDGMNNMNNDGMGYNDMGDGMGNNMGNNFNPSFNGRGMNHGNNFGRNNMMNGGGNNMGFNNRNNNFNGGGYNGNNNGGMPFRGNNGNNMNNFSGMNMNMNNGNNNDFMMNNNGNNNDAFGSMSPLADSLPDMMSNGNNNFNSRGGFSPNSGNFMGGNNSNMYMGMNNIGFNGIPRNPSSDEEDEGTDNNNGNEYGFFGSSSKNHNISGNDFPVPPVSSASSVATSNEPASIFSGSAKISPPPLSEST